MSEASYDELVEANGRMSRMLMNHAERLEAQKRVLLAIGWEEGLEAGRRDATHADNPYRGDEL
jgi:hypothetical protein